jgi:hypothetical protein
MVVHAYNLSSVGGIVRRITVQGWPWGKSVRPYLKKITKAKKGWGFDSSGRAPVLPKIN